MPLIPLAVAVLLTWSIVHSIRAREQRIAQGLLLRRPLWEHRLLIVSLSAAVFFCLVVSFNLFIIPRI